MSSGFHQQGPYLARFSWTARTHTDCSKNSLNHIKNRFQQWAHIWQGFCRLPVPTLIAVKRVQTTLKKFEDYQGLGASIFAPIYNLEFYILHVSVPILSLFSLRVIFFSKTSDCKKRQMPSIQISEKKELFSNQILQH